MSYNCDDVTCLSIDAHMEVADIRRLYLKHEEALPEQCFLSDLYKALPPETKKDPLTQKALDELAKHDPEKARELSETSGRPNTIKLTNLRWQGEGSGHSFVVLLKEIAPCIHGTIEAVLVWEGGDSTTGLRIEHGEAEVMNVEHKLVPKPRAVRR